jgi:hypothetical protein
MVDTLCSRIRQAWLQDIGFDGHFAQKHMKDPCNNVLEDMLGADDEDEAQDQEAGWNYHSYHTESLQAQRSGLPEASRVAQQAQNEASYVYSRLQKKSGEHHIEHYFASPPHSSCPAATESCDAHGVVTTTRDDGTGLVL